MSLACSSPIARIADATKYRCVAIGDSYTFSATWNSLPEYYPFVANVGLQRLGCSVAILNSGQSGDSTAQVLVRARLLATVETGSLGIIYAGTNDLNARSTVQASPEPTTTTFSVAAGKGTYYRADTSILLNGVTRTVLSVSTDEITLTDELDDPPAAGEVVMPDTTTNLIETASEMAALGYTRQVIGRKHYLNFTSGGDTLSAQQSLAAETRAAQDAAIAGIAGCIIADFYTHMRDLIVTGTYEQGDHLWHVDATDSHLNAVGEGILADCIMAAIPADWLAALRI